MKCDILIPSICQEKIVMKNAFTTKHRILSFLLISAMALSVTSCGKKEKEEVTSDTGSIWGDNNDTNDEDSLWGEPSQNPTKDDDSLWGEPSSNPSKNEDSLWGDPTENPTQAEEEEDEDEEETYDPSDYNEEGELTVNGGGLDAMDDVDPGDNDDDVNDKWAPPKLDHYADEKSLYVEDGVLYIDDYLLGLEMDEVDTYFGGVGFGGYMRYEGHENYDYYVSLNYKGNDYTLFFLHSVLRAIFYEVEVSDRYDLGEKRIAAYKAMSGGNYTVHKDPITENAMDEGVNGYGFCYTVGKGYVDLYLNMHDDDDKYYVAIKYSLK